jgi:hypothetical protein
MSSVRITAFASPGRNSLFHHHTGTAAPGRWIRLKIPKPRSGKSRNAFPPGLPVSSLRCTTCHTGLRAASLADVTIRSLPNPRRLNPRGKAEQLQSFYSESLPGLR